MSFRILSLHPHSVSTKIALYEDSDEIAREEIHHDPYELSQISDISVQRTYRLRALKEVAASWTKSGDRLADAVIGMAYMPVPTPVGVYLIDGEFLRRIWRIKSDRKQHNLGALLAASLTKPRESAAYALLTFSSDEFDGVARMSGIPSFHFGKMTHAIYIKGAARRASRDLGIPFGEVSLVVAHLGRGFSICAHSEGRIRDMTITFERGPFSQARSGGLPSAGIVRMAYSGMWSKNDLLERLHVCGGLMSYMETDDLSEVMSRMAEGDEYAAMIMRGMIYQTASEIAAMAVTLGGSVDAIVLEGSCTLDDAFVEMLKGRISWITDKILVYREDDELIVLARAALKALRGEDQVFRYTCAAVK
ncbi:MAG: butyrate kinase [Synergistaceae bacterium]|jgi:butyrate kinase|nr:butyrate kinase [Synergistaceae bacterium]